MVAVNPEAIIAEARVLLSQSQSPVAEKLRILDESLSEGDWLHLLAAPTKPGVSALDFVNEIERIEIALRKKFGEEILIVPAKGE